MFLLRKFVQQKIGTYCEAFVIKHFNFKGKGVCVGGTSNNMFIPRHGHSIIVIVEVTNATGAPNAMVDYNISYGS